MLQTMWSWQPALYLFLGGMGAGAFVMAAVLFLIDRTRHRLIVCVSMWAALASLAVGLLLLLSELITPARGLLMWQSFGHFTSWMTYGAWGAFAAMAVFAVSALLATRPVGVWLATKWKWFEKHGVALRRVLAVVGIVLGAFVAVYTGMLLMSAGGVPLWNMPLLPALFTVSAFDTGVALVEIVAVLLSKKDSLAPKARVIMERVVVVLVLVECVVMAAFLASMLGADGQTAMGATAASSAALLVSGGLAACFWGMVVACGLVLPLVMAAAGLVLHRRGGKKPCPKRLQGALMAIGAAGALIGGCELRFLILAAGIHADVVAETVKSLIG
ncbi:NrfD/PsrC family molybdoenzyme membrane anchor subunit [Eggerthella sinensis]|uniref:NrfD/PsrC family molybdoenzyme membrane anchor subunit n=1 Tax=Eggerthella sinensis TaxID=242230 RepID=UPI001D07854D|nr:NrfD/PsrC family molybdoenzyme membrane anchor subunit [Eggerthella sinensis]MCB7039328.1 polysulfide reductase NrfD [Eggerthella sinensis]